MQVESQESDGDISETVPFRPRPTKGTKLVNNPRNRSETASSGQSGRSSPTHQSELTASPKTVPQHIPSIPSEPGNRTPTGVESDESGEKPVARKVPSFASLKRSISPVAPAMPVLPSAVSVMTTDDSDTDFQSAYSRNSRGSTGSLESRSSRRWSSDFGAEASGPAAYLEPINDFKQAAPDFPNPRNRLTSTATAIFSPAESSPNFNPATIVSRGRKREPIENIF
jgi:nicotinamide N-methyltransferase